jgi:hypothetical protein
MFNESEDRAHTHTHTHNETEDHGEPKRKQNEKFSHFFQTENKLKKKCHDLTWVSRISRAMLMRLEIFDDQRLTKQTNK